MKRINKVKKLSIMIRLRLNHIITRFLIFKLLFLSFYNIGLTLSRDFSILTFDTNLGYFSY